MSIKCTGARCIGANHNICQDEILYKVKDNYSIIAVSDGAGSKQNSHIGARKALFCLEKFFDKFTRDGGEFESLLIKEDEGSDSSESPDLISSQKNYQELTDYVRGELLYDIKSAIHTASWRDNLPENEYAATLIFTVVYKGLYYITGHIGDGGILSLSGSEMKILSMPENGEYKNTTFFFTEDDANEHFRICINKLEDERSAFLICTDGISDLLFHAGEGNISKVATLLCSWLMEADNEDEIEKVRIAYENNLRDTFSKKSKDDLSVCVMSIDK